MDFWNVPVHPSGSQLSVLGYYPFEKWLLFKSTRLKWSTKKQALGDSGKENPSFRRYTQGGQPCALTGWVERDQQSYAACLEENLGWPLCSLVLLVKSNVKTVMYIIFGYFEDFHELVYNGDCFNCWKFIIIWKMLIVGSVLHHNGTANCVLWLCLQSNKLNIIYQRNSLRAHGTIVLDFSMSDVFTQRVVCPSPSAHGVCLIGEWSATWRSPLR